MGVPSGPRRVPVTYFDAGRAAASGTSAVAPTEKGPVVALLDTGLGAHPWFTHGVIAPVLGGIPIGLPHGTPDDPEVTGVTLDNVNGFLDPLAGHGTFVAGIIRQRCPSARILPVRVMLGDGICDELDLIPALEGLYLWQLAALDGRADVPPIDVLNLSMGYYHEDPDAVTGEEAVFGLLKALADLGVLIVAGAGNGSTDVEFWPAALGSVAGAAPVVAVGSTNPDIVTVSSFSNTGRWVHAYRPAGAVVSTMPVTFNASLRGGFFRGGGAYPARGSIDLDDFSGGFGLWSGTSFAAPAYAGDAAVALASRPPADTIEERVARAREVVASLATVGP